MTQKVPWTAVRIWTMSAVIATAATLVAALVGGARWIPFWVVFYGMALWVVERVAHKANAAAAEQAVVAQEVAAERALARQAAREQAAAERAAREAATAQEAAEVRAAEQARAAAAEQAADQALFDDLVQEAHRRMAEGRSGE